MHMNAALHVIPALLLSLPGAMEDKSSQTSGLSKDVQSSLTPEEPPVDFMHIKLEENEPIDVRTKDFILKKATKHQILFLFFDLL